MLKIFRKKILLNSSILLVITLAVILAFNYETFCKIFAKDELNETKKPSFRLTDIVCSYVEKLYVYPEKIKPKKLLQDALTRLEKTIPELLVDINEPSGIVTINVDKESTAINVDNIHTIKDTSFELKKAFTFINENKQSEKIEADDIMYDGLNGMLTKLDPHTIVLTPKDFKEFKIGTSGQFGGLGMVVGIRDGILTVISPIESTPAYEAGLRAGDQIIEIDGESTINMTLSESVSKLRGKPNTFVTIAVIKFKATEQQSLSIERKIIKIPTVDDKVLEDGIGYIKIRNFQNDTTEALKDHLEHLKENNQDIKGIIIDLRNNSGGLLDQAIQVTDQFIDSGNIVITVGPGGKTKDIQKARKSKSDELDFPIVLLINSSSASGAEIVVGALKENNRGIVIGNRSFGKGTVQQLIDLIDGAALKLTMAKYLTPLFNEVQAKGITPDILFTPVTISSDNIDFFKEYSFIREEDLLKHENSNYAKKPTPKKRKLSPEIKYFEKVEKKPDEENEDDSFIDEDPYKAGDLSKDRLVQFAKQIIKRTRKSDRNEILNDISSLLNEIETTEEKKILTALKEIGIDWSDGTTAQKPKPVASLSIKLDSSKSEKKSDHNSDHNIERVNAGKKIVITVSVSNEGKGTMYKTRGITESENIFLDKLEFVFGMIKPGETKSYTKSVEIPKNAIDREDEIVVKFNESQGNNPDDLKSKVRIESLFRPRFAYSYQISDKGLNGKIGNNDGLIQKNEDICLTLFIKNIGKGISEKTSVSLKNVSEDSVFVKKGLEEIGELRQGETKTVDMEFKVKEELSFDKFNMDVLIRESTFGSFILSSLTLHVNKDNKNTPELRKYTSTLKILKDSSPVFGARWQGTDQITVLPKDTIIKSDGWTNGLYRVNILDKYGWISESLVKKEASAKQSNVKDIDLIMQHIPPSIDMDTKSMNLLSNLEMFEIKGTINDDKKVNSVYAFVNNEKVYYKSQFTEQRAKDILNGKVNKRLQKKANFANSEKTESLKNNLDFSTEILLKDGPNTVTIIAKDNEGLVNSKSIIVTKSSLDTNKSTIISSGK